MFEEAREEDFIRFYKGVFPATDWRGKVMRRGRLVVAVAGIVEDPDGTYWGFLDLPPWERKRMVFRESKRFLDQCARDGIDCIRTTCDDSIERAEIFLERLGFERTGRTIDNKAEWIWRALQQ